VTLAERCGWSAAAPALGDPSQCLVQRQKLYPQNQRGGEGESVGKAQGVVAGSELGSLAGDRAIDGDHLGSDRVEEVIHCGVGASQQRTDENFSVDAGADLESVASCDP